MIDDIEDPPSLVLEYLDDNLLKISSQKRLKGLDLKHIARNTLEALASLHDKGFVHTGNTASIEMLKISSLIITMI